MPPRKRSPAIAFARVGDIWMRDREWLEKDKYVIPAFKNFSYRLRDDGRAICQQPWGKTYPIVNNRSEV